MSVSHVDFGSWTRRRVGLIAGSIAASLAGLGSGSLIDAKKKRKNKKKKKRRKCKKLGESCLDGGRRCCNGHTCGGNPANGTFCCKQGGDSCNKDRDCCNEQCVGGSCALN